jgi:hypothetical protein
MNNSTKELYEIAAGVTYDGDTEEPISPDGNTEEPCFNEDPQQPFNPLAQFNFTPPGQHRSYPNGAVAVEHEVEKQSASPPAVELHMVEEDVGEEKEEAARELAARGLAALQLTAREAEENELEAQKAEQERKEKELAAREAEQERREKELAARDELAAQKAEQERREKELAAREAEQERREKELAAREVEQKEKELAARMAQEELESQELQKSTATETRKLVLWYGEYHAVTEIVGRKFDRRSKVWKYEVKWEDGGKQNWVTIKDFKCEDLWREYDAENPRGNTPPGEKQVCLAFYSNLIVFSKLINNIHPSLNNQWSLETHNQKKCVSV